MIVIPAIDLRGGRAVRLLRGNPDDETSYADDPVGVATRFQEEGARRLHVIDLDAALDEGENREVVRDICAAVVIPVQIGGGVRTLPEIEAVLELGAARRSWAPRGAGPLVRGARRGGVRRADPGRRRRARRARHGQGWTRKVRSSHRRWRRSTEPGPRAIS